MNPGIVLLTAVFAICVAWSVVSFIMITAFLDRRGVKTPFPFMRLLFFRNLHLYAEITKKETGKVGFLYHSYLAAINVALLLAIIIVARLPRG